MSRVYFTVAWIFVFQPLKCCCCRIIPPSCVPQALSEEKASYEKEMNNMKARFEEEGSQMKESQARALEEVAKKHRVTMETSLASAEKDKNRLLAVSPVFYL